MDPRQAKPEVMLCCSSRASWVEGCQVTSPLASRNGYAYDTKVRAPRVVLDTNVLFTAARSKRGASAKLLSLVGSGLFEICLSVPLVFEYEDVLLRDLEPDSPKRAVLEDILNYLCRVARRQEIFFLWRPYLRDPKDDLVLELAVAVEADAIISYNKRDFGDLAQFAIRVYDPKEFLQIIGVFP